MRITSAGGGPAGLYLAILARQAGHDVVVHERLQRGVSHGWGVVFWDDLVAALQATDRTFADSLMAEAFEWHDQVISVSGRPPRTIASSGYSIGRHRLLELLADRAEELGADLRFGSVFDPSTDDADLVVAADGVRSATRDAQPGFGTSLSQLRNRFMWLGTDRVFDAFEFPVRRVDSGWIWAHAYGFGPTMSTFVVETTPQVWAAEGFDRLDADATLRRLESVFADRLDGARLLHPPGVPATAPWRRFDLVSNERWSVGTTALVGDAAHTTHFSIGSGTRLALEDAIALGAALRHASSAAEAAHAYDEARRPQLHDVQAEALNSARWFEDLPRFVEHGGTRFAELLERRRSPLMGRLPVPMYVGLMRASAATPGFARPAARALRRVLQR